MRPSTLIAPLAALLTVAPAGTEAQVPDVGPLLVFPSGLALEPGDTTVLVADRASHYVLRIHLGSGATTVVAGTGVEGDSGDNGPATEARFKHPEWLAFDGHGHLIVADRGNHRLRRVDMATGVVTTIAGTGAYETTGDGGPAVDAAMTNPFGVVLDRDDNIFVFDTETHRIRRIDAVSGIITTVIGTGEEGFGGDGGPGTTASMFRPHNGVFDHEGRLVFGDSFNQRIRRWDPETGIIETIAGIGERGEVAIGRPATASPFRYFGAMVYQPDGSLVFTSLDRRVVRIDRSTGLIELIAGTGEEGATGDGGPATEATFGLPYGLVRTAGGDFIVADAGNASIRRIDGRNGIITTVVSGSDE
jgi:sugar lactone lactonase YvrE